MTILTSIPGMIILSRAGIMSNKWRTIISWVYKVRLHGRRGKGTAESFSRQKLRQAPQEEGGGILCDLLSMQPRRVRPQA